MKTFTVSDTNEAMYPVYSWLQQAGVERHSRNGRVLQAPEPVSITYINPMNRVNLCPVRDCNPAFHMLEAVWMLSGSNELAPLARVVSRMREYSDNQKTLNSAYGYRARRAFEVDQLWYAGTLIRHDPTTRQAVVQLWHSKDLCSDTLDKACNMSLMLAVSPVTGRLDMHITNRSNDAIWGGVSGANVAHFPFLLEYMAKVADRAPGYIVVTSNNLHAYLDNPKAQPLFDKYSNYVPNEFYKSGAVDARPLFREDEDPGCIEADCNHLIEMFMIDKEHKAVCENEFIANTARPLLGAWSAYERNGPAPALAMCPLIEATDWRAAMTNWLWRRQK